MTKFRRVNARNRMGTSGADGGSNNPGTLECDATVRRRIKMVVVVVVIAAAVSCLSGCYVIVPIVNFGELTIPRGDMGFLNKYEDTYDMRKIEGVADAGISGREIRGGTSTPTSAISPSDGGAGKKNRSPTAGELLFKK